MSQSDTTAGRDPIRDAPLRDPGQSLREQLQDRLLDSTIPWLLVAVMMLIIAAVEWVRWLTNAPYQPIQMTLIAVCIAAFAGWRFYRALQELPNWKLGLKGERAVGQYLQATLLPRQYFVIHDICIDDFNIDHAVIGPGGVFAIEVKTRSKPRRGDAKVTYDGKRVLVTGFAPDRDPLIQARAGAKRLQEILERFTGRSVAVRPVVIFPNWFVDRQPAGVDIWVLNEKAFVGFLERESEKLNQETSRVLAEGLARYVRERFDSNR
jgi:hypothetical protein